MEGAGEQLHLSTAEAAKFATIAYTYGSGQGSEADKRAQAESELEGTGWKILYNFSNRQLTALYNDKKDHLHVAHKGTQPNSTMGMMDLVSDVKLGLGNESKSYQFNYRLGQTEKIYNSVKPQIFTMSGHSLGGATVIYALEKSKLLTDAIDQADTFNAGASPWPRISENLKYLNPFKYKALKREDARRKEKLNRVVTHHRIEKDFVSVSMRARPPTGEIRMYPLAEAMGDDRKDDLKKMNIVSKGLEAHHLDHFTDDSKTHMTNFKSTNYKGAGRGSAPHPGSSGTAGAPAVTHGTFRELTPSEVLRVANKSSNYMSMASRLARSRGLNLRGMQDLRMVIGDTPFDEMRRTEDPQRRRNILADMTRRINDMLMNYYLNLEGELSEAEDDEDQPGGESAEPADQ
jgi:hypothetical protein